jgi:hypothetical protein
MWMWKLSDKKKLHHNPELVETWTTEALDFLVDIAKHPQVSEERMIPQSGRQGHRNPI